MNLPFFQKKKYKNVVVYKDGNSVYIRTRWDATYDLLELIYLTHLTVAGAGVTFRTFYLIPKTNPYNAPFTGGFTAVKGETDDSAPPLFNGTYDGANHGPTVAILVTATGHGKTVADVGSKWVDSGSHNFYIMKIVDANSFWVLSENTSATDVWAFTTTISGTSLTHVENATHTDTVNFTAQSVTQLLPGIRNTATRVLLNGRTVVAADGVYYCNFLQIDHEYDILDVPSILAYVKTQVGGATQPDWTNAVVDTCAKIKLKHRWYENGSCSIQHEIEAVKGISLGSFTFVQAEPPVKPSGGSVWAYVPGVAPFSISGRNYDLAARQDITSLADVLIITPARYATAGAPPYRWIEYTKTSGGAINNNFGFSIGYCPEFDDAIPSKRAAAIADAGTIYTSTLKVYPQLVSGNSTTYPGTYVLPAGSKFSAVVFRCPINYTLDADATNFSWYMHNKDVFLNLDYHTNVDKSITLPEFMAGKSVAVLNKSDGFTLKTSRVSKSGTIDVAVTGSYGTAELRIR